VKYDICGLGNALVDALVLVDDGEILARHQLRRGTMHLVDDARWQAAFSEVKDEGVALHPGGSCANAIATAALLGADATFIGMVGEDTLGDTYAARMQEALGGHFLRRRKDHATGKCLSLVSRRDAERTLLTDLGAAMQLRADELPDGVVEAADWLHITGYLFTGGAMPGAAFAALDRALLAGTRISFDVGDAFVIQHFRDVVERVIRRYADIVFMNEEEGRLLAGGDAAHALHEVGSWVDTAVVKLGRRGSLIKRGGGVIPVEAVLVEAVDTTGAGDAYAGGFLYGLCRGLDLERCGHLASRVAALTVAQVGGVLRDRAALQEALVAVGVVPLRHHTPPA
jgi:sugar/nucleoside kinase (ribokinase family)